jgi:3-deoxy-D-manno-octulosonic-acid transferase
VRRLYTVLLWLALPWALLLLAWRGLRQRDYWSGGGARFGLGSARPGGVWVHAVSVGEVQAASALVAALRAQHRAMAITLTSATPTGRARARQALPADVDVRFAPYDLPQLVQRALARLQPRLLLIVETELWPNLLHECVRAGVPVLFASARVSARSARRYQRFPGLLRASLAGQVWVLAQTRADADRFVALGAAPERVEVAGNIKFDRELDAGVRQRGAQLRAAYAPRRGLWAAGSVHPAEWPIVLEAHKAVCAQQPGTLLVLAPRHRERFDAAAAAVSAQQLSCARRSTGADGTQVQVLLLDTLGELVDFYAAADATFVGGSLIAVGGHNLLEPAALGVPVLAGPYQHNSPDVARLLSLKGGLRLVYGAAELAQAVTELLTDAAARGRQGEAALAVVRANRGALRRAVQLAGILIGA